MILRNLQLTNFRAYGGEYHFHLAPGRGPQTERPVVLFVGQNGVGKSTLMEAVRLGLHGSLVLGHAVGKEAYLEYLSACIHEPLDRDSPPCAAAVGLEFDHVRMGSLKAYRVQRSWTRTATRILEDLEVWEDGKPLTDLTPDQKETLLRELVPPCLPELFFFDGERLQLLSSDGTHAALLRDMVQALLGLHLVERLQADLDVFLSRRRRAGPAAIPGALEEAVTAEAHLRQRLEALDADLRAIDAARAAAHQAVVSQEHRIAQEGGAFAERYGRLKATHDRLDADILTQRTVIQEMASGLVPFAIVPELCCGVADQLNLEEQTERACAARELLTGAIESLQHELRSESFWDELQLDLSLEQRSRLLARMNRSLHAYTTEAGPEHRPPLLHASAQDRATLQRWIEDSLTTVPQRLCQAVVQLASLEEELGTVKARLSQVPAEEVLQPLVTELLRLRDEEEAFVGQQRDAEEERAKLCYEQQQSQGRLRAARERLAEENKGQVQVELAVKAQAALEEYERDLRRTKLEMLGQAVADRFVELCRKTDFVDRVEIDPDRFTLTLFRRGRPIDRELLSAGEKQLLATAILWGLRDISRLPIPVMIDTPVARLDRDHRAAMAGVFLARISHQTIVLATDVEFDRAMLERISPLLARCYYLAFDERTGCTSVQAFEGDILPRHEFLAEVSSCD